MVFLRTYKNAANISIHTIFIIDKNMIVYLQLLKTINNLTGLSLVKVSTI